MDRESDRKRNSYECYSPLTQSPPADWSSNHSSPAKEGGRDTVTSSKASDDKTSYVATSKRPPASAARTSKRDSGATAAKSSSAGKTSQHRSMSCGRAAQPVTSSAQALNKPMMNGTFNPRSLSTDSTAAIRQAKVAEFENNTIVKQRHELNLLIEELQDRDKELNKMVDSHKQQLLNWEKDRRTILTQDEKISRLEGEIQMKKDELRALTSKLRVTDAELLQRGTALTHAQEQLRELSEQQSEQLMRADELHSQVDSLSSQNAYLEMETKDAEARNQQLCGTLMELNKQIQQVEGREQELVTLLKLKDKDLSESSKAFAEVTARLKKLEVQHEKSKRHEAEHRRNASEWKNKYNQCWKEYEYYKHEFTKAEQTIDDSHKEMTQLRQENVNLRKELSLATEREKRTDAVLDMQKSKQDRSDQELQGLRDLYSEQEREIRLLQLNLDGTKEIMVKQQERFAKGMSTSAMSTALNTGRSSSPTKSDYQCSLPDALTYQISSLVPGGAARSRSPYRKSWDGDVNARMRSPLNRRVAAAQSSPRRRSDLAAYSPTRMRASSPDVHATSATSATVAASRFVRQRSPENYKRGSPERHRLKSMSPARLGSPDRIAVHRAGNFSSVPRFELYNNNAAVNDSVTSATTTAAYASRDTSYFDDFNNSSSYLPYKSYSSDYRPATWANTRDLASAADRIMEKYYPRVGDGLSRPLDAAQSDSKVACSAVAKDIPSAANQNTEAANDGDDDAASGSAADQLTPMRRSQSDSIHTEQFEYGDRVQTRQTTNDVSDNSGTSAAATHTENGHNGGDAAESVTSQKSALDLLLHDTSTDATTGGAAKRVSSVHSSGSGSSSLHTSLRLTSSAAAAAARDSAARDSAARDSDGGGSGAGSEDVTGERTWQRPSSATPTRDQSAAVALMTSPASSQHQQRYQRSDSNRGDMNKLEKMLSFDSSSSGKNTPIAGHMTPQSASSGRQTPQPAPHVTSHASSHAASHADSASPASSVSGRAASVFKVASDAGHRSPQSVDSGGHVTPPRSTMTTITTTAAAAAAAAVKTSPAQAPPPPQPDRSASTADTSPSAASLPPTMVKPDGSSLNEQDILVMFAQVHSRIASNKLATQPFSPLMNGEMNYDALNTSQNNSTTHDTGKSDTGSELLIDALD